MNISLAAARRWVSTLNEAINYHHVEFSLYRTVNGAVAEMKITLSSLDHFGIVLYCRAKDGKMYEQRPNDTDLKVISDKARKYREAAIAARAARA